MSQNAKVQATLRYIETHLDKEIKLVDLAKIAHLSKYHYHRLFHKIAGDSVIHYVNKRRMERAAEDLAHTDTPILEIALTYQYSSQESFSRAFKRIYAMSPGQYRNVLMTQDVRNVVTLSAYSTRQIKDLAA